MKRYFFLLCLFLHIFIQGEGSEGESKFYKWAVLGAGPAGIAVVGNLLDYHEHSIVWIDSDFSGGELGKWYYNVPSNSLVKTFIDYFQACESFKFKEFANRFDLAHMDLKSECLLGDVVKPLIYCTAQLRTQIDSIHNYCIEIEKNSKYWILTLATGEKISVANLVLATGCHPKVFNLTQNCFIIPLHIALDPVKLASMVNDSDTVAVFGNSHSGMLVVQNLCFCKVKKILSFSKNPIRYAVPVQNNYIYTNTGLKGSVARWAKTVYEDNPPLFLNKVDSNQNNIEQLITPETKVIFAIGFERNIIQMKGFEKQLNEYDPYTGIIDSHFFGLGIAFPEKILDLSGEWEWNVGLIKFMKYAKRVVPQWIQHANEEK